MDLPWASPGREVVWAETMALRDSKRVEKNHVRFFWEAGISLSIKFRKQKYLWMDGKQTKASSSEREHVQVVLHGCSPKQHVDVDASATIGIKTTCRSCMSTSWCWGRCIHPVLNDWHVLVLWILKTKRDRSRGTKTGSPAAVWIGDDVASVAVNATEQLPFD